jgi:hypothetical protein
MNSQSNPFALLNTIPSTYKPNVSGVCYEGDSFKAYLSARDPEEQIVTYFLMGGSLPVGAFLDPTTGIISGTLSLAHLITQAPLYRDNTWVFAVGAFDGVNPPETDITWFSITVKHIPTPPQWAANSSVDPVLTLYEGDNISNSTANVGVLPVFTGPNITGYQIQGVVVRDYQLIDSSLPDVANNRVYATVTYSATGLPSGFSMTSNGVITGQLPPISDQYIPKAGTLFTANVAVATTNFAASKNFQIRVNNVNVPPIWSTGSSLGAINEFASVSIQLAATDADGDTLTYAASGLPGWLSLQSNGLLTGTAPLNPSPRTIGASVASTFTATVSDGTAAPVARTFTISVTTVNRPPVWNSSGFLGQGYGGNAFSTQLSASDPDTASTGQSVTYLFACGSFPPGLNLSAAGAINGTLPVVGNDTNYAFTVGASDGLAVTYQNFSITSLKIPEQPPVWDTPSSVISDLQEGTSFGFQLQAHSPQGHGLSFFLTAGTSWPPGIGMSSSGFVSGTHPTVGQDTFWPAIAVGVSDGVAETDQVFFITTRYNAPPVVPHGSVEWFGDADWYVPGNVTLLNFDWVVGAGGGGGQGLEKGNGGGGGGGGSGGVQQNVQIGVNGGDWIHIQIGQGGSNAAGVNGNASDGGHTIIYLNGNPVIDSGGGHGGFGTTNIGSTYISAPGGDAGYPNGNPGQPGSYGTGDRSSGPGGDGGDGPPALGGERGHGGGFGQNGGNGTGYGSGGGGGGFLDRTNPLVWSGGNGANGYARVSY